MTTEEKKEFNRLVERVELGETNVGKVYEWIDIHVANRVAAREHQIIKVIERSNPGNYNVNKTYLSGKIKDLPAPDLRESVFIDKG